MPRGWVYAASRRATRKKDDAGQAEVQIGSIWTGDCRLALQCGSAVRGLVAQQIGE